MVYDYKWVCKRCKAVHWYRPKRCQGCGNILLEKISNKKESKMEEELNLEVDPLRLDEEWINHPKEYHHWALKQADAQHIYDQAKAELELTRAELDRDIRANPEVYGIGKVSEKSIENTIIVQSEYQAVTKNFNFQRYELERAKANVDALDQRKRQLTILAELWIRDYYSEATVKGRTEEGKGFEKKAARSKGRKRREREKEDESHTLGY